MPKIMHLECIEQKVSSVDKIKNYHRMMYRQQFIYHQSLSVSVMDSKKQRKSKKGHLPYFILPKQIANQLALGLECMLCAGSMIH